jgi:hypothetical protein
MVSSEASPLLVLHPKCDVLFQRQIKYQNQGCSLQDSVSSQLILEAIPLTLKSASAIPEHPLSHPHLSTIRTRLHPPPFSRHKHTKYVSNIQSIPPPHTQSASRSASFEVISKAKTPLSEPCFGACAAWATFEHKGGPIFAVRQIADCPTPRVRFSRSETISLFSACTLRHSIQNYVSIGRTSGSCLGHCSIPSSFLK